MKTLVIFLSLCGIVCAESESVKRSQLRIKIREHAAPLGVVPVKYHGQFGPYRLWVLNGGGGLTNFEARFVTIRNGTYVFGIDESATSVTKTKQTRLYAIPMRRFSLQDQEELRKEFQKRQKDLKEKRVTYPEGPEEEADQQPVAAPAFKRGSHEPPTKTVEQKPTAIPPGVKVK